MNCHLVSQYVVQSYYTWLGLLDLLWVELSSHNLCVDGFTQMLTKFGGNIFGR